MPVCGTLRWHDRDPNDVQENLTDVGIWWWNAQIANFECGYVRGVIVTSMLPCLNQIYEEGASYVVSFNSRSVTKITLNFRKASREGTSSTLFLFFCNLFFELGMSCGYGIKRLSISLVYVWVIYGTSLRKWIWWHLPRFEHVVGSARNQHALDRFIIKYVVTIHGHI